MKKYEYTEMKGFQEEKRYVMEMGRHEQSRTMDQNIITRHKRKYEELNNFLMQLFCGQRYYEAY